MGWKLRWPEERRSIHAEATHDTGSHACRMRASPGDLEKCVHDEADDAAHKWLRTWVCTANCIFLSWSITSVYSPAATGRYITMKLLDQGLLDKECTDCGLNLQLAIKFSVCYCIALAQWCALRIMKPSAHRPFSPANADKICDMLLWYMWKKEWKILVVHIGVVSYKYRICENMERCQSTGM